MSARHSHGPQPVGFSDSLVPGPWSLAPANWHFPLGGSRGTIPGSEHGTEASHGPDPLCGQSERRRGQDDHRRQPRRALARGGRRTLLVDLDPQCNATTGLGRRPTASHPLVAGTAIAQGVLASDVPRLDLLPGTRSFRDVELLTRDDPRQAARLRESLAAGFSGYDFVLIDCPPSLGPLTKTALASSSEVLMPIQCEFFAMEGLTQMIEVIREVINGQAHELQFGGIVLTMYDHSLELTHEVDQEVREFFGEIVYHTVIPRDVAVSEAPSHGKTVIDYDPRAAAAGPM